MLLGKKVPDLMAGIECNWFDFPYWNDLQILDLRHPSHRFRNVLGDGIGCLRITRGLGGDDYSCRKSPFLQCRRTFEEEVVRTKVLHDDDVARTNLLRTHEALPYRRNPEPACQRPYENDYNGHPQAEFPRRLD